MRRRLRGGSVLLAAALLVALGTPFAPAASAHAVFVSMTPADGSLLQEAPTQVSVVFNEPVQDVGAAVVVRAPSGASVTDGAPMVVDATVTQRLVPLTETGTYTVAYRITSTDGHPVQRELSFAFRSRSAAASGPGASSPAASQPAGSPSTGPPVGLLVGGIVAVLLVVALVALLRRRTTGSSGGSAVSS